MSVYVYPSEVLTRLTLIQANDFWGDDTTSTHCRLAPRTGPSLPGRHNFFDFLHFRQPVDGSPQYRSRPGVGISAYSLEESPRMTLW
jgi:hypothetical protein